MPSLHWSSQGCVSHKVLYLPIWNPLAFSEKGIRLLFWKRYCPCYCSSYLVHFRNWQVWQVELSMYKTTSGTPVGLRDTHRGPHLIQGQNRKYLYATKIEPVFFPLPLGAVRDHEFNSKWNGSEKRNVNQNILA